MPISGRHDDPLLEQFARDTFALFPFCHRCGQRVGSFEEADVRVHTQRVVHRDACPPSTPPADIDSEAADDQP